jgi:hypothetical protein
MLIAGGLLRDALEKHEIRNISSPKYPVDRYHGEVPLPTDANHFPLVKFCFLPKQTVSFGRFPGDDFFRLK